MSDCSQCKDSARSIRVMGWTIGLGACLLVILSIAYIARGEDLQEQKRELSKASSVIEGAENFKTDLLARLGRPIEPKEGAYEVVICNEAWKLCILAPAGTNGRDTARLYQLTRVAYAVQPGNIVTVTGTEMVKTYVPGH